MEEIKAKFITVKKAAELIGISVSGIYRLSKHEGFPKVVKTGRSTRFYTEDIEKWIDNRRTETPIIGALPSGNRKQMNGREHGYSARHDLFAAAALTGLLAAADCAPKSWIGNEEEIAKTAHAIAEAMTSSVKSGADDTASA